jgi:hypothetical protein
MDLNSKQNSAREAKALVALAFRIGPIETIHAGKSCPTCDGQPGYGRITDPEMKEIMKSAVNKLYRLLRLKVEDPRMYESEVRRGTDYTTAWDEPEGAPSAPDPLPVSARLPDGGVLVTIPLSPLRSAKKQSDQPYPFEQLRNRLERIVSYLGIIIEKSGLVTAHECKVERSRLNLLLVGHDPKAIAAEFRSYLKMLRLPDGSKMVLFAGGLAEPEEIDPN